MGQIKNYISGIVTAGTRFLGTIDDATSATENFSAAAIGTYLSGTKVTPPASAGDTGTAGDYAVTSGFAYFCVATDTWERVAIATW